MGAHLLVAFSNVIGHMGIAHYDGLKVGADSWIAGSMEMLAI
jgi:hypothetical protein